MNHQKMTPLTRPVNATDHTQGSQKPLLTLVEYGDYECSYCATAYFSIKDLQKKFDGKMLFIYRNFPLTEIHPLAELAAEAAEAADSQGHFWEMHDGIYENQESLGLDMILKVATKIGLDIKTFKDDLAGHKFKQRVMDDFNGGLKSGVNGTPAIFVNGLRYEGPLTQAAVLKFVRSNQYESQPSATESIS